MEVKKESNQATSGRKPPLVIQSHECTTLVHLSRRFDISTYFLKIQKNT